MIIRDKKYIILRVMGNDGSIIRFRTLRHERLEKLMNSYCEHLLLRVHAVRFVYFGSRIRNNDTPMSLDMENNDMIEAMEEVW